MMRRSLAGAALALICVANLVFAGTSGKVSGRVTDKSKQPLTGVNVTVVGMRVGAVTDADGRFQLLNIPSGKISVKVGLIGYRTVITQDVEINADNTTRLDIVLEESVLQLSDVVVTARRPVVDVHRTSNIATVSRSQLQALPVQELADVVNLQAGVVDGHFRGGREGEVQYQVDGVSVNNVYDNKSTLKLDRSLLEEVQVISGTFDAEYGQAMSGVVNAVLKRGSDTFHWEAEAYTGGPVYGGNGRRTPMTHNTMAIPEFADYINWPSSFVLDNTLRPASQQNYQLSLQGPTFLPKTTYLVSARHFYDENWVHGWNYFLPQPSPISDYLSLGVALPLGDRKVAPLGYSDEMSGVVKIANHSFKNVDLSWQGLLNVIDARAVKWQYALMPEGSSKQRTLSITQGVDLTHTLSPTKFYNVSVRQNYFRYRDMLYDSVYDPRYLAFGEPKSVLSWTPSFFVQGVDATRFEQKTNGFVAKASFVDQQTKDHQLKVGGELQLPVMSFGSPGYLVNFTDPATNITHLQRITTYSAEYPGVQTYHPVIAAAFGQEEVEWNDLTLRGGLRFEYFSARSTVPSNLANPANSIADEPLSHPVKTTPKMTLAPRLGVSYPISEKASLFFAYGHFYQLPGLKDMFTNADYDQLSTLQPGSDASPPVMGNPDIKPEKTVQYQFGYKHAISEFLGLDATAFYKDIRDLLGTEVLYTYTDGLYTRMTNVDFGSVIGFTLSLTRRTKGLFGANVDYTWQSAQGNASLPNETATLIAAHEDPRPRSIPFEWDQRHTLNITLMLTKPDAFNLSSIIRLSSGRPYTPAISSAGFNGSLETNSGHKPNTLIVDLRGDRRLSLHGLGSRGFVRVFNLFDTRFDNGNVFNSTGDPYYSRYPSADLGSLLDPTRFYGPRRIEVGITLNVAN